MNKAWFLGALALAAFACTEDDPTDPTPSNPVGPTSVSASTGAGASGGATTTTSSAGGGSTTTTGAGGSGGGCSDPPMVPAAQDCIDGFQGTFFYLAQSTLGVPVDVLNITFTGPAPVIGPVTITNAGYDTCQTCVLYKTGCDENLDNCDKTYLANGGTIDVTSTGTTDDTFAGTVENVTFVEVTIDPQTFASTPVPGGETLCWSSYAFSSVIQ